MTKDLKAVTSSRSEADGEKRRLEGQLQETQTRLGDAERVNTEQSEKIQKLEQDLKDAFHKRKGPRTKKEPLQAAVETVQSSSVIESKETIVCESFSDDNKYVTVSSNKRSVEGNYGYDGYCFLNHQKIEKNQILKWSLRVPNHCGGIGMVIILE